jgi:hypothetical protein
MRNDTTQKYDTPAAISATLDIPAGRIQFIAADRADTTVEIRPEDTAKSSDVKAAERIEVAYSDGILRIQGAEATSRILGNSGSVDVTVQLPAGSRIEAKAAVAEFRGVGQLGDVTFEGATGSVKLDETTSAHITLQSGDVSVGLLRGPAQISTRQGSLRIDEATLPPPWTPPPRTAASTTRSGTPTEPAPS